LDRESVRDVINRTRGKRGLNTELTIIVPTFNEKDNVRPLVQKLDAALAGIKWEVIFVDDDSPDGTAGVVRELGGRDPRVRCIQRIGRRGLSSASIEGMLASAAPYMAVMDGDLQHDERLLPLMLNTLQTEQLDIVVGSRYVDRGSVGKLAPQRIFISRFATTVSRAIIRADLKDPMSGFFMLRRSFLDKAVRRLTGKGFKILLDLFASSPEAVRFKEIPFQFGKRHAGESKLDTLVAWEYVLLVTDKLIGRFVPVRFILFVLVGLSGVLVHLAALGAALKILKFSFVWSQASATFIAMTSNFIFNNIFTYRDCRLRGSKFLAGLFSFYVACGIGAFVNVQVASFLYAAGVVWWLAGVLGAVVGSVWNYAVTSTMTWSAKSL